MENVYQLSDGDLRLWVEQKQSICLRSVDDFGDAVELSLEEAEDLAVALQTMIAVLRSTEVD